MADPGTLLREVDEEHLGRWLRSRRWFGAKAADLSHFGVLDVVTLRDDPPPLSCALVEARFNSGMHDLYQLLVSSRDGGDEEEQTIGVVDAGEVFDALSDPAEATILARLMQRSATIAGAEGTVDFHWTGQLDELPENPSVRPMGVEQSNSTICLLYTSPSPRDGLLSRMPSSA